VIPAAALVLSMLGCESGVGPGQTDQRAPPVATALPVAPPVVAPAALPTAPQPAPGHGVEWKGNIEWHTWDDARTIATRDSKPMLVLVYADWCPHCRELGPVFADPQIEQLSKRFVMVRQNHDDDPAWLQPYNQKYGGYVPRIFFFEPSGKLREDITSGHPRYPFFYAAEHSEFLKASMRRAAGS
jgi:thiol-disulfide isomerase/thioredoxin